MNNNKSSLDSCRTAFTAAKDYVKGNLKIGWKKVHEGVTEMGLGSNRTGSHQNWGRGGLGSGRPAIKAKSSLQVRKDGVHGGKLITGRHRFSTNLNAYCSYGEVHDDDILASKDFVGTQSGTIREIDESKDDPSYQNETFGARSLGPWKNNPIHSYVDR